MQYYILFEERRKKSSRMDVIKYFRASDNEKLDSLALNVSISGCSLSSQLSAAKTLKVLEEKQEEKKKWCSPRKFQK